MADTIIRSLWDYFMSCPLMDGNKINIDYLPDDPLEFSIDVNPATEIVKRYVGGSSIRQHLFVIRSANDYGPDVLQNLANSGFYEQLSAWMEEQCAKGNLPVLPAGQEAQRISAQSTGYLFAPGAKTGKYQIQCRLQYFQEA